MPDALARMLPRPLCLGLAMLLSMTACSTSAPADDTTAATTPAAPATPAAAGGEDERGFVPLFDGSTLTGWHAYRKSGQPISGWSASNGELVRTGAGGDIVTDREYGDFDLRFEWKISEGGNSGVFYRATEQEEAVYWTGIEYQVLDDARHPDGKNGPDRHAGAVYGLYPPVDAQPAPVGEWNQGRIVAQGAHVSHWLNGRKVAEYDLWTPAWKARIADTKFKDWPHFGEARRGLIGLQDHGDAVSFRNIRIKAL